MLYIKKPIIVEAVKITENMDFPEWLYKAIGEQIVLIFGGKDVVGKVKTLEGDMYFYMGDYLIRGIEGEIYPCRSDIFEKTYEKHPGERG